MYKSLIVVMSLWPGLPSASAQLLAWLGLAWPCQGSSFRFRKRRRFRFVIAIGYYVLLCLDWIGLLVDLRVRKMI